MIRRPRIIQRDAARARKAAAVGASAVLLLAVAGCGSDNPSNQADVVPATAATTAQLDTVPVTATTPESPAVTAGPASSLPRRTTTSSVVATSVVDEGHRLEPGNYQWTLWGDPADYGSLYASEQCTELRAAANDLRAESLSLVEDPAPGQRFLAAVAAMPDQPSPPVQAAIEHTVAIYTRYAPIWEQVRRDADNGYGLQPADNPIWRDAIDAIVAAGPDLEMAWAYENEQCPAVGHSDEP